QGGRHVSRGRPHPPRPRVGRSERASSFSVSPAGRLPPRLLRRLGDVQALRLEDAPQRVREVHRTAPPPSGHCVYGARRLVLGASALAAAPRELRPSTVPAGPGRMGAAALPLDRARRATRRLARLELRGTFPPPLRPPHVPWRAGVRLHDDAGRRPARLVWPRALPGHARLRIRPRLEARERVRRETPERDVLLRVRTASDAGGSRAPGRERPP